MDTLSAKMEQVKDDHAVETVQQMHADHADKIRNDALFVLGRITQNDHIGTAIAENLSAQSILALQRFQKDKMFVPLGFDTFDEFLSASPYSPMSKRQYYDRLGVISSHGADVTDLLTSIGISMRSQKLLERGDIEIRDDQLYVAGQPVEDAGSSVVKDAIVELVESRRDLQSEIDSTKKKLEKAETRLKVGKADYETLRRHVDSLDDTPRVQRTLMKIISAMLNHIEAVGEIDDAERQRRGNDELQIIAGLYFKVRDAYGVVVPLSPSSDAQNAVDKALAKMDFEDLD